MGLQAVNMPNENDLKQEIQASSHDVDLGQILDVQATPEEERKVLQKLDFVQVSVSMLNIEIECMGWL